MPRGPGIVVLVVQCAGVVIQADDAVIGGIRFPLAGGLLIGETDAEFALTRDKGVPGSPVPGQR